MPDFTHVYGRLSYRRKSTGAERGSESWSLTKNRDGSRTMQSLAATDDSQFVRDVVYTLSAEGRPTDVFVRLQVGSVVVGTGYFKVGGDRMHVATDMADSGRTRQTVSVPPRFLVTTHAVILDGWPSWIYDHQRGGEQILTVYNTSSKWNGTDGPLGRMETVRFRYVGDESVTVPAGVFPCQRYRLDSDWVQSPTSEVWVTGDSRLLVRYDWGETDLEYVLASLATEPSRTGG